MLEKITTLGSVSSLKKYIFTFNCVDLVFNFFFKLKLSILLQLSLTSSIDYQLSHQGYCIFIVHILLPCGLKSNFENMILVKIMKLCLRNVFFFEKDVYGMYNKMYVTRFSIYMACKHNIIRYFTRN